jgi:hypothetical protein
MCSAVPDSHADGAGIGETDGRGDPPASTFPGQRSTDRTIGRGSAPVHGWAEAGVGSGEGGRRAAAGPATSVAVPRMSPTAPAPSWRRVLATTIGLWVSRRLPTVGARWWPGAGRPVSSPYRWPARRPRRPSACPQPAPADPARGPDGRGGGRPPVRRNFFPGRPAIGSGQSAPGTSGLRRSPRRHIRRYRHDGEVSGRRVDRGLGERPPDHRV